MAGKTLRVLARGTASVPVHGAHARGQSRFVGRTDDFELGTSFVSTDETGIKTPGIMPARVCTPEPHVFKQDDDLGEFTEQLLHLRYGDLWPFDEDTARIAGVTFDPEYGGEYKTVDGKLVNVAHHAARAELAKAAAAETPTVPEVPKVPRPTPTLRPTNVVPAPSAEEK